MSSVTCHISISLDGFVAGPRQSLEHPIGEGGMRLRAWVFETESRPRQHGLGGGAPTADSEVIEDVGPTSWAAGCSAAATGPWEETWTGWWGEDPPYHVRVSVLTHHPRDPLSMRDGTTFTFVTDGIESALAQARAAG